MDQGIAFIIDMHCRNKKRDIKLEQWLFLLLCVTFTTLLAYINFSNKKTRTRLEAALRKERCRVYFQITKERAIN